MGSEIDQLKEAISLAVQGNEAANKAIIQYRDKDLVPWDVVFTLLAEDRLEHRLYAAQSAYEHLKTAFLELVEGDLHSVRSELLRILLTSRDEGNIVCDHLCKCVALAYVNVEGGVSELVRVMTEEWSNPLLFLQLLTCIPQEAFRKIGNPKTHNQIKAAAPRALELCGSLLTLEVDDPGARLKLESKVLDCILEWVKEALIPLAALVGIGLYDSIVATLRHSGHLSRVVDILEVSLGMPSSSEYDNDEGIQRVFQTVLDLEPAFYEALEAGEDGMETLVNICSLQSTLTGEQPEAVASGSDEALRIVKMQLECCRYRRPRLVQTSLPFWDYLLDLSPNTRHGYVESEALFDLLDALVDQCCVPMQDDSEDEEERYLLRMMIKDTFESLWSQFRSMFFSRIRQSFLSAGDTPSIQYVEVLSFVLSSLASSVKQLRDDDILSERYQLVHEVLNWYFETVPSWVTLHQGHPIVLAGVSRMMSAYHFWISKFKPDLIPSTLMFLLEHQNVVLPVGSFNLLGGELSSLQEAQSATVSHFAMICASWKNVIGDSADDAFSVIDACIKMSGLGEVEVPTLAKNQKGPVLSGLCHLISGVLLANENRPAEQLIALADQCNTLLAGTVQQLLGVAQTFLSEAGAGGRSGRPVADLLAEVEAHVSVLVTGLRYMVTFGLCLLGGSDDVKAQVFEQFFSTFSGIWTFLRDAVTNAPTFHPGLVEAVTHYCAEVAPVLGSHHTETYADIWGFCRISYERIADTGSLNLVRVLIEIMRDQTPTDVVSEVWSLARERFGDGNFADRAKEITALYSVYFTALQLCPSLLLARSDYLSEIMQVSVACIEPGQCADRETLKQIFAFWGAFTRLAGSEGGVWAEVYREHGYHFLYTALYLISRSLRSDLRGSVARPLLNARSLFPSEFSTWSAQAVTSMDLGALNSQREKIAQVLHNLPLLEPRRFGVFLDVLLSTFRGADNVDALYPFLEEDGL